MGQNVYTKFVSQYVQRGYGDAIKARAEWQTLSKAEKNAYKAGDVSLDSIVTDRSAALTLQPAKSEVPLAKPLHEREVVDLLRAAQPGTQRLSKDDQFPAMPAPATSASKRHRSATRKAKGQKKACNVRKPSIIVPATFSIVRGQVMPRGADDMMYVLRSDGDYTRARLIHIGHFHAALRTDVKSEEVFENELMLETDLDKDTHRLTHVPLTGDKAARICALPTALIEKMVSAGVERIDPLLFVQEVQPHLIAFETFDRVLPEYFTDEAQEQFHRQYEAARSRPLQDALATLMHNANSDRTTGEFVEMVETRLPYFVTAVERALKARTDFRLPNVAGAPVDVIEQVRSALRKSGLLSTPIVEAGRSPALLHMYTHMREKTLQPDSAETRRRAAAFLTQMRQQYPALVRELQRRYNDQQATGAPHTDGSLNVDQVLEKANAELVENGLTAL